MAGSDHAGGTGERLGAEGGPSPDDSYNALPVEGEDGSVSEPIPTKVKLAFAAPTVAMLPYVVMFSLYGNTSYESFDASLGTISVYTAFARSFDVVSDPLMSYLTDSTRTRFGRRRPFMFVGCFLYSISLWCLQSPPYGSASAVSNWFGVMYILYFFSNTLTTIPYYALAPELSRDPDERTSLFFLMSIFEAVATLVAVALPLIFASVLGTLGWNYWVCRPQSEVAALCYEGRSCYTVFADGVGSAFRDNASLAAVLEPLGDPVLPEDARACSDWLADASAKVLGALSTVEQNDLFCSCTSTCDAACAVADARTSFQWVGAFFAIWMIVSMLVLVGVAKERKPCDGDQPTPLVPALLNTMMNAPFRILLPAWACDSFCNAMVSAMTPFFVKVVVEPSRQTLEDHGRDCNPDSDTYASDWFCEPNSVVAVCGICVLSAAIAGLPLWKLAVSRVGKVHTWLVWSLTMAMSNCLFLMVGKGNVILLWIISALNGLPIGAKFLADSILSDIIDYDQFLTGQRNEATYFMFKGFLPKIVLIPASAVPIALLATVGYVAPVAGVDQEQPDSAKFYVKAVVFTAFIFSTLAFFLKWRYPLTTDDQLKQLRLGLQAHQQGDEYPDPVTGTPYKPMSVDSDLQKTYQLLDHFRRWRLYSKFVFRKEGDIGAEIEDPMMMPSSESKQLERLIQPVPGAHRNLQEMRLQVVLAVASLIASVLGTAKSMDLLSSDKWQWVPTLFAVGIGLSVVAIVMSTSRLLAASKLLSLAKSGELTEYMIAQVILHRDLVVRVGSSPTS